LDPAPAPWRTIESSPPGGSTDDGVAAGSSARPSRTALAIFALAGLVVLASFVVAVGSGAGGSLEVDGGSPAAVVSDPGGAGPGAADGSAPVDGDRVVVEIVGAVAHPGVFHLPVGARIGDLVEAAGGFGPRVDTTRASSLNLAAVLKDGDQVRVPSRDDAPIATPPSAAAGGSGSGAGSGPSAPVDLNRATSAELEALPGIGPVTAGKIVASREAAGRFVAVEDLRTRKLVGEKLFEQLKPLVTVG
jgi:competence protein ComEA